MISANVLVNIGFWPIFCVKCICTFIYIDIQVLLDIHLHNWLLYIVQLFHNMLLKDLNISYRFFIWLNLHSVSSSCTWLYFVETSGPAENHPQIWSGGNPANLSSFLHTNWYFSPRQNLFGLKAFSYSLCICDSLQVSLLSLGLPYLEESFLLGRNQYPCSRLKEKDISST